MTDNLSPEDRKKAMRAVKGKGTSLERSLFSMLAGMGIRGWRKNASDVIGKPDVAFDKKKIAIFIDGCFWHGCKTCNRPMPISNQEYWQQKISRNIELSKDYNARLRDSDWIVFRIWEHQIKNAIERVWIREEIRQILHDGPQ